MAKKEQVVRPIMVRLAEAMNVMSNGKIKAHFIEASSKDLGDPEGDDLKFRPLTSQGRDVSPLKWEKLVRLAYVMWQKNPMARWIIDTMTDFCVGDEFHVELTVITKNADNSTTPDPENKSAQIIWDEFWSDPINRLSYEFADVISDGFLNGEIALSQATNPLSGKVRIGVLDPANVKEVLLNENDVRQAMQVRYQLPKAGGDGKWLQVIKMDMDPKSPTFEKLVGEVFYFRANKLTNEARGTSELGNVLDYLDLSEKFMWNGLEAATLRNTYFYDITLEGMTAEEIAKIPAEDLRPPRTAKVKAHNEKVKWEIQTPDLKAMDISELTRLYTTFVITAKRFPGFWFMDTNAPNRATSEEMGVPTMRMLKRKQKWVKDVVRFIAQYVVDQAMGKTLKLKDNQYVDIKVHTYDFERKDASTVAAGFVQVLNGLTIAVDNGWISDEDARKFVSMMMEGMGIEVDQTQSVEDLKAAAAERDAQNIYKGGNPPAPALAPAKG